MLGRYPANDVIRRGETYDMTEGATLTHEFYLISLVQHLTIAGIGLMIAVLGYRMFRDMPALQEGSVRSGCQVASDLLVARRSGCVFRPIRHRADRIHRPASDFHLQQASARAATRITACMSEILTP